MKEYIIKTRRQTEKKKQKVINYHQYKEALKIVEFSNNIYGLW